MYIGRVIGLNTNFNMTAPGTWRWDKALEKLPYYVHIAPFVSEMAEYADIVLPASTFLEEWAYDHSPPGSGFAEVRIKQPVVEPIYDTKSSAISCGCKRTSIAMRKHGHAIFKKFLSIAADLSV